MKKMKAIVTRSGLCLIAGHSGAVSMCAAALRESLLDFFIIDVVSIGQTTTMYGDITVVCVAFTDADDKTYYSVLKAYRESGEEITHQDDGTILNAISRLHDPETDSLILHSYYKYTTT
jgi:hypothetical protein